MRAVRKGSRIRPDPIEPKLRNILPRTASKGLNTMELGMAHGLGRQAPTACTRDFSTCSDYELVALARRGDGPAFGALIQRCNRRHYRIARGIVRSDHEAEDVVQEAYVCAYIALPEFRGDSSVTTWLTRIVLNEAVGRMRSQRPQEDLAAIDQAVRNGDTRVIMFPGVMPSVDPETAAARAETRRLLEAAINDLPDPFRVTFLMRDVEGLSTAETADALGIRPETVKNRLHRARQLLQKSLHQKLSMALKDAFPFEGERCERITSSVLERLGKGPAAL